MIDTSYNHINIPILSLLSSLINLCFSFESLVNSKMFQQTNKLSPLGLMIDKIFNKEYHQ